KHLHNEFNRLAALEPLNVNRKRHGKRYPDAVYDYAINTDQLFTEPQVAYLNYTAIGENTTARTVPKVFFYSVLEVADIISTVKQQGVAVNPIPVIFIIDEFEELISEAFLPALAMARSLGVGCLMGHQTIHQLNLGDRDLTNNIIATTSFKHILSAPDL